MAQGSSHSIGSRANQTNWLNLPSPTWSERRSGICLLVGTSGKGLGCSLTLEPVVSFCPLCKNWRTTRLEQQTGHLRSRRSSRCVICPVRRALSLDVLGCPGYSQLFSSFQALFQARQQSNSGCGLRHNCHSHFAPAGRGGTRVRTRRSPRSDTGIRRQSASHASPRQVDLQNGWEFTELHEVGSVFLVALCGACPFRHPACQTAEAPGESTMGATKYVRLHGPWAQLF